MPTHISLTNTLMDGIVDHLETRLVLLPDIDDEEEAEVEAIAGLIRKGKLQDDPTIEQLNILIHPANKDDKDELYDRHLHGGFRVDQPYEIGGFVPAFFWVKKFFVDLRLFFDNELEREIAQTKAQVVLSRAHHAIFMMNGSMRDYATDSFGMKAHNIQVKSQYLREGGGPGTFIWRGQMLIEVLCHMEPVTDLE